MSDDARRGAQRRWQETGSPADGRRYLASLQRAGDEVEALRVRLAIGALHEERARLAAHLGHPAARAALELPDAPTTYLEAWARQLFEWGQAACVRAALAAARGMAARGLAPAPSVDPLAALAAAEDWLACPCPQHYAAAEAFNGARTELPDWAWQTVTAAHCPPRSCWHHVQTISAVATTLGSDAVRAAVREALVAWALPAEGGEGPLERPPCQPAP